MEPELLFTICSRMVLPAWLLLIFFPRWKWTRKLVFHAWIPMLLGLCYVYCFYAGWSISESMPEGGGFGSLEQVMLLFQVPFLALAGWIHYLAFDLFVGAWEVRDAQRRALSHWLVVPCLVLTFLAGPLGLLLYFLIRASLKGSLTTVETA